MRIASLISSALLGLASLVGPLAQAAPIEAEAGHHSKTVHARDLKWVDAVGLPAGTKMAILYGNPEAEGVLVIRLRLPAGTKIAPHLHPTDEWVTVLAGAAKLGMGDKFDLSQAEDFAAGDLHFLPAEQKHFVKTLTPTLLEIHTTGPWGITYVNPVDDPRQPD